MLIIYVVFFSSKYGLLLFLICVYRLLLLCVLHYSSLAFSSLCLVVPSLCCCCCVLGLSLSPMHSPTEFMLRGSHLTNNCSDARAGDAQTTRPGPTPLQTARPRCLCLVAIPLCAALRAHNLSTLMSQSKRWRVASKPYTTRLSVLQETCLHTVAILLRMPARETVVFAVCP